MSYPKGTLVYRPISVFRKVFTKRAPAEGEDTDDTDSPPKMVTVSEYTSDFHLKAKVQYLWFEGVSGTIFRAAGGATMSRDVTFEERVNTRTLPREYRLTCKNEVCKAADR